jgi:23S rRNA (uridine2552-2'-O)-methyltransferase
MAQKSWRSNQSSDEYFIKAKKLGFRSRSVFKLKEIDKKYKVIKKQSRILDLGSFPGGWSEYIAKNSYVKTLIANDIQPMESIDNVKFIQGDFSKNDTQQEIIELNNNYKFNLILSDISTNKTGNKVTDQYQFYNIANNVLEFSLNALTSNGVLVIKVFIGHGFDDFKIDLGNYFEDVYIFKPKSSRPESKETYAIGKKIRYTQNL